MKLLFDTHTFIWWADAPEKLSATAFGSLRDEANSLVLSVASMWEMQIKVQLGKLKFRVPLPELIEHQRLTNDLQILAVDLRHVFAVGTLPPRHKDPFDRLLTAQALVEDATLVTVDPKFTLYPAKLLK